MFEQMSIATLNGCLKYFRAVLCQPMPNAERAFYQAAHAHVARLMARK
jgi:hypothetical protein